MSLLKTAVTYGRGFAVRSFCTGNDKLLNITKNDSTGVTTVSMQKPPVNSLNLDLLVALRDTLIKLEKEKCKGMILTSESPSVFSAGLDIMEMYRPDHNRARKFWTTLQDTWIKLYSSPYPTVAAINGHSPAGGCLLALSCEYRVMVGPKFTIGLNETQLGIVAPFWFQDCMRNAIGERQAELALTLGKMFSVDEALKVGLIDEIAKDKADAISKAEDFLDEQSGLPALARSTVKVAFREATLNRLLKNREADTKMFLDFISMPKVQQALEMYMQTLKKK